MKRRMSPVTRAAESPRMGSQGRRKPRTRPTNRLYLITEVNLSLYILEGMLENILMARTMTKKTSTSSTISDISLSRSNSTITNPPKNKCLIHRR